MNKYRVRDYHATFGHEFTAQTQSSFCPNSVSDFWQEGNAILIS